MSAFKVECIRSISFISNVYSDSFVHLNIRFKYDEHFMFIRMYYNYADLQFYRRFMQKNNYVM